MPLYELKQMAIAFLEGNIDGEEFAGALVQYAGSYNPGPDSDIIRLAHLLANDKPVNGATT